MFVLLAWDRTWSRPQRACSRWTRAAKATACSHDFLERSQRCKNTALWQTLNCPYNYNNFDRIMLCILRLKKMIRLDYFDSSSWCCRLRILGCLMRANWVAPFLNASTIKSRSFFGNASRLFFCNTNTVASFIY